MNKLLAVIFITVILLMPEARADEKDETATVAGGCFWCMEPAFESLDGVKKVVVGYTGGATKNPTYEEVSTGRTGHVEAAEITFDPGKISYSGILDVFWRQIDPTDAAGQFADKGSQYKTAIFYHDKKQKEIAEQSKKRLESSGRYNKPIATKILKAGKFYPAEEYHQDYYKKEPGHYNAYKTGSGREAYIEKMNKKMKDDMKNKLTPFQYEVTQACGTEPPFRNEYWDNKREGIYVDIVSGEPLFSSTDKFESGTGWPSFTKPIEPGSVKEKEDKSVSMVRVEVRSSLGDSHLGHVFNDGPAPTGLRYCVNSAALRFIPREDLEKEGYGEYKRLFEK